MIIENKTFDEERALYGLQGATLHNCRFDGPADGESALKECSELELDGCYFNLRYPLWHVNNAALHRCELTELCRAALWYDDGIRIESSRLMGIKALRECKNIELRNVQAVSPELFWRCRNIRIDNCAIESEYAMFESEELEIHGLHLKGKYTFQYVKEAVLRECILDTKDAFWHSRNVTVYDSVVRGEYLGWYSENLKLVRCKIIGTQPLCYCKGLVLEDCIMEDTDLCFERSEVNATVNGGIDSVKNPASGSITADAIGELILEPSYCDAAKTEIRCRKGNA